MTNLNQPILPGSASSMLGWMFDGPIDLRAVLIAIVVTLVAGWIAARAVRGLAAAGLRTLVRDTLASSSPLVRRPLRLIGAAAFLLVVTVLLFPAFEMASLRPRTGVRLRSLATWAFGPGLHVVLIVILAYALVQMTSLPRASLRARDDSRRRA